MTIQSLQDRFASAKLTRLADGLAAATAISLPWSTSAVSILMGLWLVTLIPTLDWASLRRTLLTPAGGLPVLFVLLGLAGMLWADVSLHERWKGFESFLKLIAIPFLLIQFSRSERGEWVFGGYVASCLVLLVWSYAMALWPALSLPMSREYGVPVRNAASQSGEFVTCMFGLLYLARERFVRAQWLWAGLLTAAVLAMVANIVFVATSRTALVLIPVLLILFALLQLSARGIALVVAAAVAFGAVGWFTSPYLRQRVETVWTDFQIFDPVEHRTSSGERIEFAQKSIAFIRQAPVIGHGTGSIHDLFIKATPQGSAEAATTNPHNQTFAVAIQLGLVGVVVLWAMWIAHLVLFRGGGLAGWIGLVIVVQNVVGSLFNSHLFDFLQGWVYVLGVGVAGGLASKRRAAAVPDGAVR